MPVPDSAPVSVPAVLLTDSVPLRATLLVGLKRVVTVQFAPAASVLVQVVDTKLKSVPLTDAELGTVTVMAPMPWFVSVAVPVALLPTLTLPKAVAVNEALGAWPVPLRLKLVAPVPLWVSVTVPVREPAALGVKLTLMTQVPLMASALPQLLDWAKSLAPAVTETPLMVRGAVPLLVTVTVCTALVVPVCCAAKVSEVGDSEALPSMPVPDKVAVTVPAPVAKLSEPERAPVVLGVKRVVTVQVAPAFSDVVQVVDTKLKSEPVTDAAVGTVTLMAARPVLVSVDVAVLLEPTCVLAKDALLKVALGA